MSTPRTNFPGGVAAGGLMFGTDRLADRLADIGALAQPASGSVSVAVHRVGPFVRLDFTLSAARISVTDAAGSGSFGALKLWDWGQQALVYMGCRQDYTAFAEGAALTTAAGDAVFDIGVGTVAKAAAADGALGGATDDDIGGEIAITLSGGTGTGTLVNATNAAVNGTGTAGDIVLNWSGTAATVDASSTIDVTGTISIACMLLGDD
jgi:hypothetical protein